MIQKQYVNMTLISGIDTKTNEKLVEGKVIELENTAMVNQNLQKVPGYDSLAKEQTVQSDSNDPKGVSEFNSTLVFADNNELYTYDGFSDNLNYKSDLSFSDVYQTVVDTNIQDVPTTVSRLKDDSGNDLDANYPAPITASFDKYYFAIFYNTSTQSYVVDLTDTEAQISLFRGVIKTVMATPDPNQLLRTTLAQEAIATPNGIFWYFVTAAGIVNEYFLSYDLSNKDTALLPFATDIFLGFQVFILKPSIAFFTSNYVHFLTAKYASGFIFFGFRGGNNVNAPGYYAVRNLGGSNVIPPTELMTAFPINSSQGSRNLMSTVFIYTVTGEEFFAVCFGENETVVSPTSSNAFFLISTTSFALRSAFGFSYAPPQDFMSQSMGYLSKNNEFCVLSHDIREFNNEFLSTRVAPFIQRAVLSGTTTIIATWQSMLNEIDPRFYLDPDKLGFCALAGSIFCDYDKIVFPIFYFPYLRKQTGIVAYSDVTPYSERRCHMLLVDNLYNVISYMRALSIALGRTTPIPRDFSTTGQYYSTPATVIRAKQNINRNEFIYGAFVESNTIANKQEVTFSYDLRLFKTTLPRQMNFQGYQRGGALYLGHSMINELSTTGFSEQNWTDFPQVQLFEATNIIATPLVAGSYAVEVIYEWSNGNGDVVRSAVSINKNLTIGTGKAIEVRFTPPPWFTKKSDFRVKIFRTTVNGIVSFLDTQVVILKYPINDTITVVQLIKPDDDIIGNEILYTSGGVLADFPFYDSYGFTLHKNVIWSISRENPNQIFFSKSYTPGVALAANPFLYVTVESRNGPVVCLASLDDKLVLFTDSYIYFLQGPGIDDTGAGQGFAILDNVVSPVGCNVPNSVVRTPDGIMFKSNKGIWLLDRSLNTYYIGADVEEYNSLTVTSAILLKDLNVVKFTTLEGIILEYDYFYKTWNVEKTITFVSSTIVGSDFVGVKSNGAIFRQNNSLYQRDSVNYNMRITTGWLKTAGLQGFQRIFKMLFLGDYKGSHIIKVSVSYDYVDAPTEYHYFNPTNNLGIANSFGIDLWGQVVPYGGPNNSTYQFRLSFVRQKCMAIRVTIEDIFTNIPNETGNSFAVTDVTFEYGQKSGINKLRVNQHI